jgi:SSS family solute:Na+ symporter
MIDQIIIGLYLVITLIIGLYVGRKTETIKDYAIGKRNFSTLILVSAIFATVVDASDTIGLAGNTFLVGPIFLFSYMGMIVSRFLTAFLIAPKMSSFFGCISSGDVLEKLFGRRAKTLMGLSTFIESVLLAGAQILAISQLTQYFFSVSSEFAAISGSLFIILYSFRGGIKSVTATDVFQFGILIIAIPIVCGAGIIEIGGHQALVSTIKENGLSFSSNINLGHHIAMFISFSLPCLYPLCIQRMLMAKNTAQIKSAFLANGLLSIPFQIITGIIGILAFILIPDVSANHAFPALVDKIVPIGLKGLVIAGLLAVIMSTVDSILNIGSIAVTNDFIGSIVKSSIKPKTSLRLAKISSVAIALGATIIAIQFNSILDILFYVLVIGNSVYFPGYFLGILGFHGSKRAFWVGVLLGIATMIVGIYVFDMFILYMMLLAIGINTSAHITEHLLEKKRMQFSLRLIASPSNKSIFTNFSRYFLFNNWIKDQDYCSIFAVCTIGFSLFHFFGPQNLSIYHNEAVFLALNGLTASISFLILFREIWSMSLVKYFPLLWAVVLVLALPLQTIFMFIRTDFSAIWLMDALAILPLLSMLTSRKGVIYSYLGGLLIACSLALLFPPSGTLVHDSLGQWAIFVHIIVLVICLALFRKKDVELCRSTSSTLVHEANRSLSTFENAATYYESLLPLIISAYQEHIPPEKRTIPLDDLVEMLSLPANLKQVSHRTRNALTRLLDRVTFYSSKQESKEICNINECIKATAAEPSFLYQKHIIEIKEKNILEIIGDRDELIHVFINLIENSVYALRNTSNPKIEIMIQNRSVIVQDNGEGISEADLPNIFDELFTTKANGGQGLSYCRNVLHKYGASIICRSKKNSYTRFDISFP